MSIKMSRATTGPLRWVTVVGLLLLVAALAVLPLRSSTSSAASETLVVTGLPSSPTAAAVSPDGSWRLFKTTGSWYRSQNGGAFTALPAPPATGSPSNPIIRNDGSVAVGNGAAAGSANFKSTLTVRLYESGAWVGPFTIGQGQTWNDTSLVLASDGATLVALAGQYGKVFSSIDAGRSWADHGAQTAISSSTSSSGRLYMVDASGALRSWKYSTRSFETPNLSANIAGEILVDPTVASTVYAVRTNANGTVTIQRSTNGGSSWSVAANAEPVPYRPSSTVARGVVFGSPRIEADGNIHFFASVMESGVGVVYETNWNVVSGGWSVPTRFATAVAGSELLVWPNRKADGSIIGATDRWVTRSVSSAFESYSLNGAGDPNPTVTTTQGSHGLRVLTAGTSALSAVAYSPDQQWRLVTTSTHLWRSQNGTAWEGIPRPPASNISIVGATIRNDGSIVAGAARGFGTTLVKAELSVLYFENGQWLGPLVVGSARTWDDTTLSMADSGSELLIVTGKGATRHSQSGREWLASSDLVGGGRIDVIGDVAHVVSSTTYQRWSFSTNAAMSFTDPSNPSATVPSFTVPANTRVVRTPGSTTEVWMASAGSSLTLRKSTDGGTTYNMTPAASEALPAGVNAPFVTVSSDGRVHLYATAACTNASLLYSTSHALGATAGFSPFVAHYLDETKTAAVVMPTGGTGVSGAGPELWFSRSQSGAVLVNRSRSAVISPESVFGLDPFGANEGGVNAALGTLTEEVTDVTVATVGPELMVKRTYNSADERVGMFGRGWTSNLESRVFENCITNEVTVLTAGGARLPFVLSGGVYVGAPGTTIDLVKNGSTGWTLTFADGTVHTFRSDGRITSIKDPDNRTQTFIWNGSNQLTTVTDAVSGRALTFGYTNGVVTSIQTTPVTQGGTTAALRWNLAYAGNELAKVCEPRNNNTTTGYCTTYTTVDGRITQITDANGHIDKAAGYDNGTIAWVENGAGDRVTFTYGGNTTSVTDELGHTTSYVFDDRYRVVTMTNAVGGITSHQYDTAGFRWKTTDPNNHTTTRTFDPSGNVTSETNGNNETTWYGYDAYNNPTSTRDARSTGPTDNTYVRTTTWTGATRRKLTETTPPTLQQPAGTTRSWTYTTGAEPAIGGGSTPAGLVKTETDPNGNTTSFRYDAVGNLREKTDPLGLVTALTYDQLGRPLTTTTYPTGFPAGVTTSYSYDGLGNVIQTDAPAVTNTVTGHIHRQRVVNVYDPAGNPTSTAISDIGGSAQPDPTRTTTRTFDTADRPLTVTDPEGGATTNSYDAVGNVIETVDARGIVHQYSYDGLKQILGHVVIDAVTDPGSTTPRNVTVVTNTYDTAGRLLTSTDPLGRVTEYGYDPANRRNSVTLLGYHNPDTTTRNVVLEQTGYDPAGNTITKTTGNGTRIDQYTYDAAGRLTSSTLDPAGLNRATTFTYDADGNILNRTITANGRTEQRRYTYNPAGLPLTETVENGTTDLTTSYTYDNRGILTATVEPRGNQAGATPADYRTNYTLDALGRTTRIDSPPVTVTDVNPTTGTATTTSARPAVVTGYNTHSDPTHTTDERGHTTATSYDRLGRPTQVTHPTYSPAGTSPITPTEAFVYDPNGNLTARTDRRGHTTSYTYDGLNRVVQQTDPQLGTNPAGTTTVVYDDAGNEAVTIDPRGARIEATYDDLNRVRTRTDVVRNGTPTPARHTTTYDYDDLSNPTYEHNPTGAVTTATYNPAGEQLTSTDADANTTTSTRDLAGRITSTIDPLDRRIEIVFDLAGRAHTIRHYDATNTLLTTRTATFDAAGNTLTITSPRGNVAGATPADYTTTFTYDALNRLVTTSEPTSNTTAIATSYGYDAAGNTTRITDGRGNTTLYDHNPWNLQTTIIEPSTLTHPALADRTYTTSYDAGGLPLTTTEPGPVTVARTFDELGNLTNESGSGTGLASATNTFTRDAAGLLTSFATPGGNVTVTYDDRRLLTGTDGPGANNDSTFTYDQAGRTLTRTDTTGTTTFTWTPRNQPASITDPLTGTTTTNTYDPAGQPATTTYQGGGTRTFTYDGLGRLTSDTLTDASNAPTAVLTVGYDPDSNITTRTTSLPGNTQQGTNTYTYDNIGRLTSWTKPDTTIAPYTWDATGNLTNNAGTTQTYDQRNRLQTSGTTNYIWTPRGTLATTTTGTTTATTFDALNRMTGVGATTVTYDSLNRAVTNSTTTFAYAGTEFDPVAIDATLITHGPNGQPFTAKNGPNPAVLLGLDPHRDLTHQHDPTGAITATQLYTPLGQPTATTGTTLPIGYQADYTDPTTGNTWMGARWYQPGTGNFTARDTVFGTLDTPISLNRYTYAWADPLGNWDPDGRKIEDTQSRPPTLCNVDVSEFTLEELGHFAEEFGGAGGAQACIDAGLDQAAEAFDVATAIFTTATKAAASFLPVVGDAMDLTSCIHRDWLSCAALVPIAGDLLKGGDNLLDGARALNAIDDAHDLENSLEAIDNADDIIDTVKATDNLDDSARTAHHIANLDNTTDTARSAAASGELGATHPAAGAVNLMGSGEDFATYAGRAAPEPGFTDVIAHSDGHVFSATPDGPTFDHRVLAGAVEGSHGYSGGPIRLLACDTGACNASGAQNLANKIGVDVLAPTEKVWALPNGQLVVAANYSPTSGFSGTGSWKTFSPGG